MHINGIDGVYTDTVSVCKCSELGVWVWGVDCGMRARMCVRTMRMFECVHDPQREKEGERCARTHTWREHARTRKGGGTQAKKAGRDETAFMIVSHSHARVPCERNKAGGDGACPGTRRARSRTHTCTPHTQQHTRYRLTVLHETESEAPALRPNRRDLVEVSTVLPEPCREALQEVRGVVPIHCRRCCLLHGGQCPRSRGKRTQATRSDNTQRATRPA